MVLRIYELPSPEAFWSVTVKCCRKNIGNKGWDVDQGSQGARPKYESYQVNNMLGGFKSTKNGCFCCNLAAILQRRACPESLLVSVKDNLFIFVLADFRSLRTRVVWCSKPSLFLRDSSFTRFPCYVLAFVKGRGSTLMHALCNIAFWVELDILDILNTVV